MRVERASGGARFALLRGFGASGAGFEASGLLGFMSGGSRWPRAFMQVIG